MSIPTPYFPYVNLSADIMTVANDSAESQLSGSISNSDVSVALVSASAFTVPCIVAIENELVLAKAKVGDTLTVERGFSGTTAVGHASGVVAACTITAHHFNRTASELMAGMNWLRNYLLSGLRLKQNLITYSSDFSASAWTKIGSPMITASGDSPIQTDANLITAPMSGSGLLLLRQSVAITGKNLFSIYAKYNSGFPLICIGRSGSASSANSAWFNLQSGATGTVGAGVLSAMVPLADDWYRCIVELNYTGVADFEILACSVNGSNTNSFSGQTIYLWGAQAQAGTLTSADMGFVETTSSPAQAYVSDGVIFDEGIL